MPTARTRALLVTIAASLLVASVLGACGGSDDSASPTNKAGTATTTPDGASVYVDLSKAAAIAKAEADGRPWRIGREDDEQFMVTQDFVENRVTFELDDGKVTKATLG